MCGTILYKTFPGETLYIYLHSDREFKTEPSKDKTKLQCDVTMSFLRLLTEIEVKGCLQEQKVLRDICITQPYPNIDDRP